MFYSGIRTFFSNVPKQFWVMLASIEGGLQRFQVQTAEQTRQHRHGEDRWPEEHQADSERRLPHARNYRILMLGYTGGMPVRTPDPEHLKLIEPYAEAIRELALAARKMILEEAPEANEFVYEVYTIANHFAFTERPSDAFVYTTTHANWVNLGFNFGAALPDPQGLLRGEGKWIRHVRIAKAGDLNAAGVRELVRAAIAEAERPEGKAGKPRTVVRRAGAAKEKAVTGRRR